MGRVTGDGSSQAANGGLLELGVTRRPARLRLLGSGAQPVWGRPGLAFVRIDTQSDGGGNTAVDLVAAPGAPPRPLFTQKPSGNQLDGTVGWTAGAGDLLVALLDVSGNVEPVLVDPRTGGMQEFPQRLMTISAIARDGSAVLGESLQGEVVAVRADGKVKVLAPHADSATWTS